MRGDFAGPGRARRVAAAVVALLLAAGVGVWIGRAGAPDPTAGPVVVSAGVGPPWPASRDSGGRAAVGPVDGGLGWQLPMPGAAGPFSVTEAGVPFGYAQTPQGAGLAAVNAVVAARYLAGTFPDRWAALGFLADPGLAGAARAGVEEFFTGPPVPVVVGGRSTVSVATVPPQLPADGGGRVLGVQVRVDDPVPGAVTAVVLWLDFSDEYRPDGQAGYTVRLLPVQLLLVWADGDWKVHRAGPAAGQVAPVLLGVLPADYPVPAEDWHR